MAVAAEPIDVRAAESAGAETPAPASGPRRWLRLGEVRFDGRRNGLNLVRLGLALAVLVSHGYALLGRPEPAPGGEKVGTWAVFGFFAISGYLITGSRLSSPLSAYVLRRLARIYPAFLVCLGVTALGFAPIAYWHDHHSLDGFFGTGTTPVSYVLANVSLKMYAYDVAGTPAGVPRPGAWDGSLWSLYYEFACYALVAVLLTVVAFRRRPALTLGVGFAISVVLHARMDRLVPYTQNNADLSLLAWLLPFFLAGGLVHALRHRIALTWPGALASAAVVAVLAWDGPVWGPQLAAPLVVYLLLWLGAWLPCPEWVRRNDVSYGVYIYAFPVQQLLLVLGATGWAMAAFDGAAVLGTAVLAVASWFIVEKPVMDRARRVTRRAPAAAPVLA